MQIPDISAYAAEVRKYINDTSKLLRPEMIKAFKPNFPNFSIDVSGVEVPTVSVKMPASNSEAADFIPTFDLSQLPTDANGQPTFDASHLGLPGVQDLLKMFSVKDALENFGVPTDAKVINEVRASCACVVCVCDPGPLTLGPETLNPGLFCRHGQPNTMLAMPVCRAARPPPAERSLISPVLQPPSLCSPLLSSISLAPLQGIDYIHGQLSDEHMKGKA